MPPGVPLHAITQSGYGGCPDDEGANPPLVDSSDLGGDTNRDAWEVRLLFPVLETWLYDAPATAQRGPAADPLA